MTTDPDLDALLPRLRERAADPARRTTVRPTQLGETLGALDLGGMLSMGGGLGAMLRNVVAANQAGRPIDPRAREAADEIDRQMHAPADRPLPAPADDAAVAAVEAALGQPLPAALRRVYREVADGGFGPGSGLLSLAGIVRHYDELRSPGMLPRGREWPDGLLPVVEVDPGWTCVDATTGRVIDWDPEGLAERSSEDRFRQSFRELHPSIEAWLADWLGAKTHEEQRADMLATFMSPESQVAQAREARAAIGRLTVEERRAMGLPDVGWEAVVWGGLGWDPDEAT